MGTIATRGTSSVSRFRVSSLPSTGPEFTPQVTMKMPLTIAMLGLFLAACSRQAPKTDLDTFQGTWYLSSATQDGNMLPADKVKQTTIVFKGYFEFSGLAEYATSRSGTVKLDETKTPKA